MTRRKKQDWERASWVRWPATHTGQAATNLSDSAADHEPIIIQRTSLTTGATSMIIPTTTTTCENASAKHKKPLPQRAICLIGRLKMRSHFRRARLLFCLPRRPLVTLLAGLCLFLILRQNNHIQTINCQAVAVAGGTPTKTTTTTESGADLAATNEFQQLRPVQLAADESKSLSSTTTTTTTTSAPKSGAATTASSFYESNDSDHDDDDVRDEQTVTTGVHDWLAATTEGGDEDAQPPTTSEPPPQPPPVTDKASAMTSSSDAADNDRAAPFLAALTAIGSLRGDERKGGEEVEEFTTANLVRPSSEQPELGANNNSSPNSNAELQLVRSRKSPEGNNSSLPVQVPLSQGRPLVTNGSSSGPATSLFAGPTPNTLDYDDFDLDYQLKLDQVLAPAPPPPPTQPSDKQTGLNKRDYDQESSGKDPPAWSALLAGDQAAHLFKSTAASLNHSSGATPGPNHLLHNTPPIMPSLLTISSGQLSHQELSKVRPHFLFYPDQYSEFSGPNSYHQSAIEALANGDLLATASHPADQVQVVAPANQSTSAWRHFGRPPPANQTENGTSSSSSSPLSANTTAGQMISLLNGSPIVNKQSLTFDNLAHHHYNHQHQNHYSQAPQVAPKLNRPKLVLNSAGPASDHRWSQSPAVTTIVVDNSVPTTQTPQVVVVRTTLPTATTPSTTSAPAPASSTTTEQTSGTTSEPDATTSSRSIPTTTTTSSEPTPAASNSSRSHQWFNYPHPNLHHNPLLLHHILNKPASFYSAHSTSAMDSGGGGAAASQAASANGHPQHYHNHHLSPVSMLTTTTTATTTSETPPPTPTPQPPVVGSSGPPPPPPPPISKVMSLMISPSSQQSGQPLPASSQVSNAINIIERPTYGPATQHFQQQPVNLTLLQMQINEMRAIANSQEGATNQGQQQQQQLRLVQAQKQQQRQFLPGYAPKFQNGPWAMIPEPPVGMLHHLFGSNMLPPSAMFNNGQASHVATAMHPQLQPLPHVRMHPPLQSGNGNLPLGRKPLMPLAAKVIGAPSFLQEVYTPSPFQPHQSQMSDDFNKSLLAHQTAAGHHHHHHGQDSLSASASMASSLATAGGNQTGMSDEDMSTYVALLASLSNGGQATGKPQEPPDEMDSLLESLLKGSSGALDSDKLEHEQQLQQNKLQAQSWIELLKSAKLIGLSDEVQARIYREYLAPLVANSSPGSVLLANSTATASTTTTTTTTRRPVEIQQSRASVRPVVVGGPAKQQVGAPAESSRTFAAVAPPTHHATLSSQSPGGLNLGTTSDQRHFYSLDPAAATLKQQQQQVGANYDQRHLEALRQRQRQTAFIEAVRLSLAQMAAAAASDSTLSSSSSSGANAKDPLAESEHQEALANSSSRPQPEWLDDSPKQQMSPAEGATAQQLMPLASSQRPSLFPHMRAPIFRGPPISLLRGPANSQTVPIYPLRALWGARHHYSSGGSGGSGPQPRLLWPVGPAAPPPVHQISDSLTSARHYQQQQMMMMQAQPTIPLPLVRLGPVVPLQPPALHLRGPPPPPPPSASLLGHSPMPLTPNRVMLDRFPMAAAPAYLVKLPTLTGGTITASGSLVPPMAKFLRRPAGPGHSLIGGGGGPPAAFISASPLGALRFLNALAPPRMRLIQPPVALSAGPPGYGHLSAGQQLQSASSSLHVGHSAPAHRYYGPHAHQPLHQLYHEHHQPRLQIYVDGTGGGGGGGGGGGAQLTVADTGNLESPTATTTTTTTISSAGSAAAAAPAAHHHQQGRGNDAVEKPTGAANEPTAKQSNPSALTRLQQATLSLVELSSLASLLDEVVGGGSDTDASPAMALANAISSLSAAQSAAAAAQHHTSERIVPLSSSSSSSNGAVTSATSTTSANNLQQQQQQAGALFWRNLLMPGLFRQSGGMKLTNGAAGGGGGRLRDLSALERLLAHTQAIGSAQAQGVNPSAGGRLKVKYIRVPVAVYETVPAGGSGGTSQTSGLISPTGSSPTSEANSAGGEAPPSSSSSSSDSTLPQSTSGSAHSSGSPAAAPTSNEFFFDEMSAESGPQTHYTLGQHFDSTQDRNTNALANQQQAHLGYLPIVRSVPSSVQAQSFMFRPPSSSTHDLYSPAASSIQSSLEAEEQQVAPTWTTTTTSDGKAKKNNKKKKKNRGKSRGKKNKHNESDDDDEEDEEGENEDEDDDAISASDLPIIESLISTIIHGPHQAAATSSPFATGGGQDPLATSASGWRSLRARRPFGLGASRGSRNAQKLVVSPEASSSVFTYALPGDGLPPTGGATRFVSSNPFHRQRFSLGEVVGALGAKKLITSLLGRRTKTARTSKQRPSVGKLTTTSGSIQHHHRPPLDSSTRTPPRDLLMLRPRRANQTASASSLKRRGLLGGWRRAGPHSLTSNSTRNRSQQHNRTGESTRAPAMASTFSPHGDLARPSEWTSTRKPQPLVYASMAAHDFEPSTAKSRLKKWVRTTPRPPPGSRPPTMDASIVSAGSTIPPPISLKTNRKPATGASSLMADSSSTNQDKMEYSFYLSAANSARRRPANSTTEYSPTPAKKKQFKDTETDQGAASLINATIVQLFTSQAPRASTPAAMPLYHIVADHYQKANSGHHLPSHSPQPETSSRREQQQQLPTLTTTTTTTNPHGASKTGISSQSQSLKHRASRSGVS